MSELPEGWESRKVEDLFKSFSGGTPSRENAEYWNGNIPWLSSGDIKSYRIDAASELITESGLSNSSAKLCRPGSVVVVVRSGILKHTLPVAVLEKEAAINQDIKCFDSGDGSLNQWLALSLRAFSKGILSLNREGTTVQSVEYDTLKEFELRVPPLPEQRRIVAKLEPLLDSIGTYQQRMAKIPVTLKRFRQAVLAAACSGELTVDWRELHQPSSPVLLADDEHIETDPTVETPGIWRWTTLRSLCEESRGICYGVIKLGAEAPDGVPCLRTSDVKPLRIDATDVKRIAPDISADYKRTILNGGEVLVNVRGTLGGVAVVPSVMKGWNISREVALVPLDPSVDAHFISFWIAAIHSQNWLSNVEKGVAYTGINLEDLRLLPVAVPSLSEQREIVRRVEALFKLTDQIEARSQKAKTQVDKLPQSILAKAFRGELVPTEAELARREGRDYEPASVLLERIRSERAKHAQERKEKAGSRMKPIKGKVSGVGISKS